MSHLAHVQDEAAYLGDLTFLSEAACYVFEQQNAPEGDVTIALVDETRIKSLNREFAGEDHSTDVLSFPHHEIDSESGRFYFGDVAICLSLAQDQAAKARHALETELLLLTVHGILHLLGHDHANKVDSRNMFSLQQELLEKIEAKNQ